MATTANYLYDYTIMTNGTSTTSSNVTYTPVKVQEAPLACPDCFGNGEWCNKHGVAMDDPKHSYEDSCEAHALPCATCDGTGR